ncbi:MAG: transposase [Thiotrichaceae bacterium]
MVRPLRIEYDNAIYHVMNRGKGKKWIYPDDTYYEDFLKGIEEAHQRFGIEVLAYCLMGNHYHLLIHTPRGNISRAMRHINGVYTQRYNRKKKTDGALFRGRYKSILIDESSYLLQVSRYIHRNPIELKKPLVDDLSDYPWSSYPSYLQNKVSPDWLYRDRIYGSLGKRNPEHYKSYVDQGLDKETIHFYQKKNTSSIWGDDDFKHQSFAKAQCLDMEIDKRSLKTPVPMMVIISHVAESYGLKVEEITSTKRGQGQKNVPRWVAMRLCQDIGSEKLMNIAEAFNVSHYSTVSQSIRRLKLLMSEDDKVFKKVNMLNQDLTP